MLAARGRRGHRQQAHCLASNVGFYGIGFYTQVDSLRKLRYSKYNITMTYAEQLTTLLVLGGITTNATMGNPLEAALMWRFNLSWAL